MKKFEDDYYWPLYSEIYAKQTTEIVKLYEEKYIREKIAIIQSSTSFKNGKVKNMARYLISALREDYQTAKNSENHIKANISVQEKQNTKVCSLYP